MEDAIKNIDARTGRIEQILPTLATRTDIGRLEIRIEEKWTHTRALFEELKQIIRTIGKGSRS